MTSMFCSLIPREMSEQVPLLRRVDAGRGRQVPQGRLRSLRPPGGSSAVTSVARTGLESGVTDTA